MKIVDVKLSEPVYVRHEPMADAINTLPATGAYTLLRIITDDGITGITWAYAGNLFNVLIEDVLKPQVVGEDPLDTERIWEKLYWATLQYGRRGAAIRAIGMIDIALWDLKGKVLNQPVHKLLGAHRNSVPVYGSGVNLNLTNEELVDQMTNLVKRGFKMVKMKVGKRNIQEDLDRIKLIRDAIGPDVHLAVDVNNGWSLTTAIRMAKEMEKYDIYWLEEPILSDEIGNLAKLASATRIPIATGENHYTRWEFKELIERGAVQIVQPDLMRCGGVTEFIKIATIADAYGLPVAPHHCSFLDPTVVSAIPNGLFVEYVPEFWDPIGQLFISPIAPVNGEISPSNKPGFGIEPDEPVVARLQQKPTEKVEKRSTKKGWRWPPYL